MEASSTGIFPARKSSTIRVRSFCEVPPMMDRDLSDRGRLGYGHRLGHLLVVGPANQWSGVGGIGLLVTDNVGVGKMDVRT